jgi:predicted  nucleic acid-binding Zn-ribbon protein
MEEMKKMSEKIEKNEKILRANLVDKNELNDLKKNVEDVNMYISELHKDFRTSEATVNKLSSGNIEIRRLVNQ